MNLQRKISITWPACWPRFEKESPHRPKASSTRVTLLKAGEQGARATSNETMGWGALTSGQVEIHTVPGGHFTIVREPYVRSLAEQLADCINKATLQSFASHT
jgi:thioesterase domain-containing protein